MIAVVRIEGKGRGLLATEAIAAGTIFGLGSVLFVDDLPDDSPLTSYTFKWAEHFVMAFGPATFVNHSENPNVEYELDHDGLTLGLSTRCIDIGRLAEAVRNLDEAIAIHDQWPSMESAMLVAVAEHVIGAVGL